MASLPKHPPSWSKRAVLLCLIISVSVIPMIVPFLTTLSEYDSFAAASRFDSDGDVVASSTDYEFASSSERLMGERKIGSLDDSGFLANADRQTLSAVKTASGYNVDDRSSEKNTENIIQPVDIKVKYDGFTATENSMVLSVLNASGCSIASSASDVLLLLLTVLSLAVLGWRITLRTILRKPSESPDYHEHH